MHKSHQGFLWFSCDVYSENKPSNFSALSVAEMHPICELHFQMRSHLSSVCSVPGFFDRWQVTLDIFLCLLFIPLLVWQLILILMAAADLLFWVFSLFFIYLIHKVIGFQVCVRRSSDRHSGNGFELKELNCRLPNWVGVKKNVNRITIARKLE